MSEQERPRRGSQNRSRTRALLGAGGRFVILLLWLMFSLYGYEALPSPGGDCSLRQKEHGNLVERLVYRPLMQLRFHSLVVRDVNVVSISEPSVPLRIMTNTCEGRRFLTDLVGVLDSYKPRVIAIDKFYSEGSCTDERINDAFRVALQRVSARVVVGQATHDRNEASDQNDCLVLTPAFDFSTPGSSAPGGPMQKAVLFGVTRLNQNDLKIPLSWWVFPSDEDAENTHDIASQVEPSFALRTAEQMDRQLGNRPSLRRFLDHNEHPYGSFSNVVPTWQAMDVLCSRWGASRVEESGWGKCPKNVKAPEGFEKKVVLIGDHSTADLQPFPGEEQYGVDLQANYIEALLQGRYVRAIPFGWDMLMVIAFVAASGYLDWLAATKRGPKWLMPMTEIRAVWLSFLCFGMLVVVSLALLTVWTRFTPVFLLASYGILSLLAIRIPWVYFMKAGDETNTVKE